MLIISQHARLIDIEFPKNSIARLNAAWIKSKKELFDILDGIKNDVFLDFPEGRHKPPIPVLEIEDLVEAINLYDKIKYFGITKVETPEQIKNMKLLIQKRVLLIPKIESKVGIDNFEAIISQLRENERYIMLDKEDLYTDLHYNIEIFNEYVGIIKRKCQSHSIGCLELQGVIFADD